MKRLYCSKCRDYTPHTYVGKESGFEGDGIIRVFMAVASLGVSEMPINTFWKCSECGKVRKD